jgi:hypothetical protein
VDEVKMWHMAVGGKRHLQIRPRRYWSEGCQRALLRGKRRLGVESQEPVGTGAFLEGEGAESESSQEGLEAMRGCGESGSELGRVEWRRFCWQRVSRESTWGKSFSGSADGSDDHRGYARLDGGC